MKKEEMYAALPVWLQHVAVSLQGAAFRYRRADTSTLKAHLAFLQETQWWDQDRLDSYQLEQMRLTLANAFEHVPYYRQLQRDLQCGPADFTSWDAFRRLPILTKAQLRGNEPEFVNPGLLGERHYHGATSGTTGTPLTIYETQRAFSQRWAYVARLREWAGLEELVHPRRIQFTGRAIVPDSTATARGVYWRRNWASNALLMSTVHISRVSAARYLAAMRAFDAELIEGYPSAMLILARLGTERGLRFPRPRAIITSAETLLPAHREELERAFGCRVHDQYAASEPSCFCGDCEAGHLHVSPEYGVLELVGDDGAVVGPGEEGKVVVTSFLNPLMPLIRYQVGDSAIWEDASECTCGRESPRLKSVLGRTDDILYVPQRGFVGRMDPVFKGLTGIHEAQIAQEALDRLVVRIVPAPEFTPATEQKFLRNLREKVGDEITIDMRLVESIPRGANGKWRPVVSSVKHLYPIEM